MARQPRRLAGIEKNGAGPSDIPNIIAFDAYVGPARETLVDASRGILSIHDGVTPGGLRFSKTSQVTPKMFGAIADGISHPLSERFGTIAAAKAVYPHAVALTDEIDWAATQAAVNTGLPVYIPDTGFKYQWNRKITAKNFFQLIWGDEDSTDIYYTGTGYAIQVGDETGSYCEYVTIRDLNIYFPGTTGTNGVRVEKSNHIAILNVRMRDPHVGISVGEGGSKCSIIILENNDIRSANLASGAGYSLGDINGLRMADNKGYVNGITTANLDTLATGLAGLRVSISGAAVVCDTFVIRDNLIEKYRIGQQIVVQNGAKLINVWSSGNIFDYNYSYGLRMDLLTSGLVAGWFSELDWYSTGGAMSNANAMRIDTDATGVGTDFEFLATRAHMSWAHVTSFSGVGLKHFKFHFCNFNAGGYGNSGGALTGQAALFWNGGEHPEIIGGKYLGRDNTGVFPGQGFGDRGIYIASDIQNYLISGVYAYGQSAGQEIVVAAHAVASRGRRVRDVRGFTPTASFALGASGAAAENKTPFTLELHIQGGTVSGIAKNGSNISGKNSGSLILEPGHSVTVTYSAAPSLTTFVS